MKDFEHKVAVITGAAGGIGLGMARHAAGLGMKVVMADIDETLLNDGKKALEQEGASAVCLRTDVSDSRQVQSLADFALSHFGSIDLVHNNAGVLVDANSWEVSEDDWKWILGVNLWGVIHGVRIFTPIMLDQGGACHMVNTSSQAGITVGPYLSPYNVTKQGVVALTETLHHELALLDAELKVSVLCPGSVATGIWHSERNRPENLQDQNPRTDQAQQYHDVVASGVAAGISPARTAEIVFGGIEDEKFWIFPHPEMLAAFEDRANSILNQKNPVFKGLSKEIKELARSHKS